MAADLPAPSSAVKCYDLWQAVTIIDNISLSRIIITTSKIVIFLAVVVALVAIVMSVFSSSRQHIAIFTTVIIIFLFMIWVHAFVESHSLIEKPENVNTIGFLLFLECVQFGNTPKPCSNHSGSYNTPALALTSLHQPETLRYKLTTLQALCFSLVIRVFNSFTPGSIDLVGVFAPQIAENPLKFAAKCMQGQT